MKKGNLAIGIAICVIVAAGCALAAAESIMLAMDNAAFDYYNGTSRQLFGWILCFAPVIGAAAGGAVVFLRQRLGAAAVFGLCALLLAAFLPLIYMAMHGVWLTLVFVAEILWFTAAIGTMILDAFIKKEV